MIKTTKTSSYQTINLASSSMLENATILMDDTVLGNLNDECEQITSEELKLLKFNDDLVQLEDDAENSTTAEQADEDDEDEDEERDLTNLAWLTELRNQTIGFVNIPLDEEPKKNTVATTAAMEQITKDQQSHLHHVSENEKSNTSILGKQSQRMLLQIPQQKYEETRAAKILNQPKRPSPAERYEMFLNNIKRDLEIYEESATNYQSNIVEKPPFNYSHIIGMAMLENGRRVTLQQICSWIERKFAFFRVRKKWNNSIRHNLSLHPCFRKIGRNKEDKGKGGYWELGVDPKKCDRKRIRNRKSTAQPTKIQKKHLQSHFIKTTKRRHSLNNNKKQNNKHGNGYLINFVCESEYEELMLDELDVQQNIDVMSTNKKNNNNTTCTNTCYKKPIMQKSLRLHNSQSLQKEEGGEVMLRNLINDSEKHMHLKQNDDFKEFNENGSLADDDVCPDSERMCQQQQQYELGTIIISSANVGADMPNLNQRKINSFLTTNSTKQVLDGEQLGTRTIRYSEVNNVLQNENAIISSYISNLSDGFSTCEHASKSNQCHNFTSASNSITLDFSAFPAQSIQQKPNVIVEQLIQQPSLSYSAIDIASDRMPTPILSSRNSSTSTICTIGSQSGHYTNELVNEQFRPYIDGIDEAFQYLRSIDNTRNEDILDNLLDISVSDY